MDCTELSRAEKIIYDKLTLGMCNRDIAAAVFISEKTVKGHVTSILSKLGFDSRAQLIAQHYQRELAIVRDECAAEILRAKTEFEIKLGAVLVREESLRERMLPAGAWPDR